MDSSPVLVPEFLNKIQINLKNFVFVDILQEILESTLGERLQDILSGDNGGNSQIVFCGFKAFHLILDVIDNFRLHFIDNK